MTRLTLVFLVVVLGGGSLLGPAVALDSSLEVGAPLAVGALGSALEAASAPSAPAKQNDDPDDDRAEFARQLVFLDQVEAYKNQGKHFIVVKGRAPDVPEGTIIDFVLTFRSMTIDTYPFTVWKSKRIDAEFEVKKFPRSREKFYFRTIIESQKQPKPVLLAIQKKPNLFRPTLDPWTDHHYPKAFRLLTSADEKSSLEPIRAFFRERLERISELRQAAGQEAELAALGEEYTKSDGSFDPVKWKKFFDGETIEPLLTIAADVRAALGQTRFIPFRRALVALESTAKSSVLSCYESALGLYRSLGLTPPPGYVEAARLDLTRPERRALRAFDLAAAEELIKIELGILKSDRVEDAYRLVSGSDYQGVLFRHLTEEELANGKFDPVRASATWTPGEDQLADLEAALLSFLQATDPDVALRLADYRRQYVGIGPDDGRIVHISLIHRLSPLAMKTLRTIQLANPAAQVFTVRYRMIDKTFTDLDRG